MRIRGFFLLLLALPVLAFAAGPNQLPANYQDITLPDFVPAETAGRDSCECIDLVFIIDSTASMGGAINNVKLGLADILALADSIACGDLQGGVLAFWDDVHVLQAMTFDMGSVTVALNSLSAAAGNDWPEASDESMLELATSAACLATGDFDPAAWRAECCKVAILVTDAPPGGCDDVFTPGVDDAQAQLAAQELAALGVHVGSLQVLGGGGGYTETEGIMLDYAVITEGIFGQVPSDGTGTADAIEEVIRDCQGEATETELCCFEQTGDCTTVLAGQCTGLGGVVVDDCDACEAVAAESSDWSTVKTTY